MDDDVAREVRAQNVFASEPVFVCLLDGFLQDLIRLAKLTANVNEDFLGLNGIGSDKRAFNDCVGVVFQNQSILESPRLTFVAVDAHILREDVLGHETPLETCREPCATATAQTRSLDNFYHLVRRQFPQDLLQRLVTVMFHVDGYVGAVWNSDPSLGNQDFLQHKHHPTQLMFLARFVLTCNRHFTSTRLNMQQRFQRHPEIG